MAKHTIPGVVSPRPRVSAICPRSKDGLPLASSQPGKLLWPAPGLRTNGHVDQRRGTAGKRLLQRRAELLRRLNVIAFATKSFDDLIIAGIGHKGTWRWGRVLW